MGYIIFLIAILAVWRVTALLVYERTARPVREMLKSHMLRDDGLPMTLGGRIITCFWCTSWIVSIPFAVVCLVILDWAWWALWILWPSISGGAILLNTWSGIVRYAERR